MLAAQTHRTISSASGRQKTHFVTALQQPDVLLACLSALPWSPLVSHLIFVPHVHLVLTEPQESSDSVRPNSKLENSSLGRTASGLYATRIKRCPFIHPPPSTPILSEWNGSCLSDGLPSVFKLQASSVTAHIVP